MPKSVNTIFSENAAKVQKYLDLFLPVFDDYGKVVLETISESDRKEWLKGFNDSISNSKPVSQNPVYKQGFSDGAAFIEQNHQKYQSFSNPV
jgi:hypothetical protein